MDNAVPLALAASFCRATSSVRQRLGARSTQITTRPDAWLISQLLRRPVWLLGIAAMNLGYVFQVTTLRFGALELVQPFLSLELLIVFGNMTFFGGGQVRRRDWLNAFAITFSDRFPAAETY